MWTRRSYYMVRRSSEEEGRSYYMVRRSSEEEEELLHN